MTFVYLLVVSQMTWSLRPIIKHPDAPWAPWGGYPPVDGGSNMFVYLIKQVAAVFSA